MYLCPLRTGHSETETQNEKLLPRHRSPTTLDGHRRRPVADDSGRRRKEEGQGEVPATTGR